MTTDSDSKITSGCGDWPGGAQDQIVADLEAALRHAEKARDHIFGDKNLADFHIFDCAKTLRKIIAVQRSKEARARNEGRLTGRGSTANRKETNQ